MKELVNEPDEEGNTPLHLAVKNENYKLVRKLMETKCADLRTKNNRGLTALDICESDWNLSYRQNSLHTFLRRQNAPPANTMSVVAALLATLTFAAAFTLPGGYHADDKEIQQYSTNDKNKTPVGSSILIKKLSLKVFVLADSVAMCCSMTVVFLLILAMAGDLPSCGQQLYTAGILLNIALLGNVGRLYNWIVHCNITKEYMVSHHCHYHGLQCSISHQTFAPQVFHFIPSCYKISPGNNEETRDLLQPWKKAF
ncbi:hypothetical protein Patl1_04335 [Pistacia atlantica]|uniref:Uncharacterized protein n=1 Tax=Pistacia atlantica TaxID=434234 RepID=A0ACC1BPZ9_9ROSI|nr:hypothetical protein Patl1_04335 [Pistacia atlantica]